MTGLDDFTKKKRPPEESEGMVWYASVACHQCGECVDEQMYYPADKLLLWVCSQGHKGRIENLDIF